MVSSARKLTAGAAGVLLIAALTGCTDPGDFSVTNESSEDVTVRVGDETAEVSAGGGVLILDLGCTDGDVTVEYTSGRTVVVPGPVCPDQYVSVDDDGATVRERAGSD